MITAGLLRSRLPLQTFASRTRGLALACHPIPSLAVTALTAGLAAEAGTTLLRGTLITLAMFAGQLSIGWCNDAVDVERDRAVYRVDKPVANGLVTLRATGIAAATALVIALSATAPLGWHASIVLAFSLICGWAYDLGLKATVWSWFPFAVAFGALPAVATFASKDPRWPAGWAIIAGALFGVAAHFTNVLPDLLDDSTTGVRGLPHRIGSRVSAVIGPALLVAASIAILTGPQDHRHAGLRWLGLLATVLVALWATIAALRDPRSHRYFLAVIVIALLDLVLFALSGTAI